MLRYAVVFGLVAACASGTSPAWQLPAYRGPVYKPGQSIAESRMCSCEDCIDRTCCSGERTGVEYGEFENRLGMTLNGCGRCVRRVWTVRGEEPCASLAGPECCPGTVSD